MSKIINLVEPFEPSVRLQCQNIQAGAPHIYYDENIFRVVCAELGHGSDAAEWCRELTPVSSTEEMLGKVPLGLRPHFLKIYISVMDQMLVT